MQFWFGGPRDRTPHQPRRRDRRIGDSLSPTQHPEVLMGIILTIIIGLVAGFIARAVVPGKQDLSIVMTIVLGLIGSFVGNIVAGLIQGEGFRFELGGWWASIIGAIVVLAVYVFAIQGRKSVRR
jgi:uncharacterized membrane protein YeaQ/YmgE (transglycosylase-associated protein family)